MGIGNKFLLFSCAQILRPKNVPAVTNGPILCSGYGSTFTLVCTPKKHLSSSDVSIWSDGFTWGILILPPQRLRNTLLLSYQRGRSIAPVYFYQMMTLFDAHFLPLCMLFECWKGEPVSLQGLHFHLFPLSFSSFSSKY